MDLRFPPPPPPPPPTLPPSSMDLPTPTPPFPWINNQPLGLPPTKIKRQYKCSICDHLTVNPRVHLRHRIDAHGHKVKIVECPMCVYACQYRQKLNRHLRLVHHIYPNNNIRPMGSDGEAHTSSPSMNQFEMPSQLQPRMQLTQQVQLQAQQLEQPLLTATNQQVANNLIGDLQQQQRSSLGGVSLDQNLMQLYAQQFLQQQLQQQQQQQQLPVPALDPQTVQNYITLMYLNQLMQQQQQQFAR